MAVPYDAVMSEPLVLWMGILQKVLSLHRRYIT